MANGDPRYELIDFSRYGSAQNMYNENMGFGGTQNFYDYDGDSLLDNFPVRPSIPASGGAGSGANIFNLEKIPTLPPQMMTIQPPVQSGTNAGGIFTLSPQAEQSMSTFDPLANVSGQGAGSGFGSRFAKNLGSPQAMAGMAKGIGGLIQGLVGRGRRRREQRAAQNQYDDMLAKYRDLDTSNLYANVKNQYTGLENAYEDLTVNQLQAEFERDMFARQQSSLMQGLSGAAGGSGIAALAQAMANQSQIATQRSSASIGMQESRNQLYKAAEASKIQFAERAGEVRAEQMRLAGATQARALDYMKTGTELGMAQQDLAAKNMAIAQANAALYGGIGSLAGTALSAGIGAIPSGS
jgi:hypothetical protein